jgi:hypothetical protein
MPLPESDWEIAERIFASYPGGEPDFWRDWGRGRLAPQTMEWFRRHAADVVVELEVRRADAQLAEHVGGDRPPETPKARNQRRIILEALALAVEVRGRITLEMCEPPKRSELRRRFAEALFLLLERDLDIDPANWSAGLEAAVGTEILRVIFPELIPNDGDRGPSPGFVEIIEELDAFRQRADQGEEVAPGEQALRELAWPLLIRETNPTRFRFEPSFRNYLRARLFEVCRERGWQPRPRPGGFVDLDAAFETLTRPRVAEVFREVSYPNLERWLAVDRVGV